MSTPYNPKSIRSIFWPIFGKEHIKFLPLALMMFFILFDYSMMRSLKDALVVTEIGSEAIGFIKTYFVFPAAILMTVVYYQLCNMMESNRVFYVLAGFFFVYFLLFATILFPDINDFILSQSWADSYTAAQPRLKWFIKILQYWPYTSFYVVSELWGSTMISLFFWQLANQVTSPGEAKRHYSMFGLLGNAGLIGTSYVLTYALKREVPNYKLVFTLLIISIALIITLYSFVQQRVINDPVLTKDVVKVVKKKKQKPSIGESIKVVLSSKYLGLLAILLVAYGVSNILIENVWKDRVRELYPSKDAYAAFMGDYQFYLGVMSMFFMLVGSNILRLVSWTKAALLTPAMFTITATLFFLFIFGSQGGDNAMFSGLISIAAALQWAVLIGAGQNILSKATKYSLFDSTQKMAYMPLDDELKTKGMSAVEVIGGRFGKMGGGVINSTLLMIFPTASLLDISPILAVLCLVIIVMWTLAVLSLSGEYHSALEKRELEAKTA